MHLTTRAQEPDFRRWYENLAIGSEITVKEAAKSLYRFLRMHEDTSTPMVLVEIDEKDRREVEDILQDFVARLRARVRELYCDCAQADSIIRCRWLDEVVFDHSIHHLTAKHISRPL